MSKNTKNYWPKVLTAIFLLTIFLAWRAHAGSEQLVYVHFLDVGQGDAIFFQTPEGVQMLIDGGPDDKVLESLRRVMPIGDRSIDWLVLSHGDADHLGGLLDIMREYQIYHILMPNFPKETKMYRAWLDLIEAEGAQVHIASERQEFVLTDRLSFELLHPTPQTLRGGLSANNYSIVMATDIGEFDLLLTGDIEEEVESLLMSAYGHIETELLKIPHHGSRSSSTPDFLDAVEPDLAILQSGAGNRYGHPHDEVLRRYAERNIELWRNDVEGTVSMASDGINVYRAWPYLAIFPQVFGFRLEKVYTVPSK